MSTALHAANNTQPCLAEQSRAEQSRAEQSRAEQSRAEQSIEHIMTQVRLNQT
jgi:hypothetical protein